MFIFSDHFLLTDGSMYVAAEKNKVHLSISNTEDAEEMSPGMRIIKAEESEGVCAFAVVFVTL